MQHQHNYDVDSAAPSAVLPGQYYHTLGAGGNSSSAGTNGQPWMTLDRVNGHHATALSGTTVEIVTVKTPHRQSQVPETSI